MTYITKDPKEHLKVARLCEGGPTIQRFAAILNLCVLQALNGFLKQSDGRDKLTAAVQASRMRLITSSCC